MKSLCHNRAFIIYHSHHNVYILKNPSDVLVDSIDKISIFTMTLLIFFLLIIIHFIVSSRSPHSQTRCNELIWTLCLRGMKLLKPEHSCLAAPGPPQQVITLFHKNQTQRAICYQGCFFHPSLNPPMLF